MTDQDAPVAEPSGRRFYPAALKDRDWWVNWVLAVRYEEVVDGEPRDDAKPTKQPVAPYDHNDASPCKWNSGLSDEDHPTTSFDGPANWEGWQIGDGIEAPPRVLSEELGIGIIIPPADDRDGEPITLLDWDDVRDPETGEIHPTVAWALNELDTYAEISQSGEGIHQFVFGDIPGDFRKYLRHIDEEPFVGDDLPMMEMYSSGRLTAMTGEHVEGTGDDVAEGQELIDELCYRFRNNSNNSTPTPSHPFGSEGDHTDGVPDTAEVADTVAADVEFDGDAPEEWAVSDDLIRYTAVLRGRERKADSELPSVSNWKLIRYAALLGKEAGLSKEKVRKDLLSARDRRPDRVRRHVRSAWRRHDSGSLSPPSVETLKKKGLLPEDYVDVDALGNDAFLDGADEWDAWSTARVESADVEDAPYLTDGAVRHIAVENGLYDFDAATDLADETLPIAAHNDALSWIRYEWAPDALGVDPRDDDVTITRRPYISRDPDAPVASWEDVRYVYDDGDRDLGRHSAEALLQQKYEFLTTEGDEQLHVYDPATGVFETSLSHIHGEIKDGLGKFWSTHELNEIKARLRQTNIVERRQLNGREQFDDPHICVANGVLNLFEGGEPKPHAPEYKFVDQVPIEYDPNAPTDVYEQYLDDWTRREADKKTLLEMVGHALVPDANERYKKFLILTGDADNGKSVFFRCVRALLDGPDGELENVANVKLEKMASNRFSNDSVYGHMANIAGEIDGKKIRHTAALKDITGGDAVEIEPKGSGSFFDTINATMMFAANDPPILGERDKKAIASRIAPVELPYSFVENPDPDDPFEKQREPEQKIEADLLDRRALSGLLKLAVEGVQRLETNHGDVSLPESPKERLERYERAADPMREFGHRCLTNSDGDYVAKADVTTIYKEWATAQGHELGSNTHATLHNALQGMADLNYTTTRPNPADYNGVGLPLRPWDERKRVVSRVTLTDEGLEYAERAGIIVDEDDAEPEESSSRLPLAPGDVTVERIDDSGRLPALEATVASTWEGRYGNTRAALEGDDSRLDATLVNVALEPGATVRLVGAKLTKTELGALELEIDPPTEVVVVDDPAPNAEEAPETAATDGGDAETGRDTSDGAEGLEDPRDRLRAAFNDAAEGSAGVAKKQPLIQALKEWYDVDAARDLVERAVSEEGWINEPTTNQYTKGSIFEDA